MKKLQAVKEQNNSSEEESEEEEGRFPGAHRELNGRTRFFINEEDGEESGGEQEYIQEERLREATKPVSLISPRQPGGYFQG